MSAASPGSLQEAVQRLWDVAIPVMRQNKELSDEFWWQTAIDDPDRILERFLMATSTAAACPSDPNFHLDKALAALCSHLKWRREAKVREIIYDGEVLQSNPLTGTLESAVRQEIFASGKGFFWGYDKLGFLVIYLYPARHSMFSQSRSATASHIIYQTELGRRLVRKGQDKVTVVIDFESTLSPASFDVPTARFVLTCLQTYYPESLNRIFLVNLPTLFTSLYDSVKALIYCSVDKKIKRLDEPRSLREHIDGDVLLRQYGGNCDYVYKYVPPHIPHQPTAEERAKIVELEFSAQLVARELYDTFEPGKVPYLRHNLQKIFEELDLMIYPGDLYSRICRRSADGSIIWEC